MTSSLALFGVLGIASTAFAVAANRHLFTAGASGRATVLEWVFYVAGAASLCKIGRATCRERVYLCV